MKKDLQFWLTVLLKIIEVPLIIVVFFSILILFSMGIIWILDKFEIIKIIFSFVIMILFVGVLVLMWIIWVEAWDANYRFVGKILNKLKSKKGE